MVWIWTSVIVLSIIIEALTCDLVSIWFTLGGFVSLILSFIKGVSWQAQLVVFVVSSLVFLICLRSLFVKMVNKNKRPTNGVELQEGKPIYLLKGIDKDKEGEVKINGVVYTAIVEDESVLPLQKGERVKIINNDGNKVVVAKE